VRRASPVLGAITPSSFRSRVKEIASDAPIVQFKASSGLSGGGYQESLRELNRYAAPLPSPLGASAPESPRAPSVKEFLSNTPRTPSIPGTPKGVVAQRLGRTGFVSITSDFVCAPSNTATPRDTPFELRAISPAPPLSPAALLNGCQTPTFSRGRVSPQKDWARSPSPLSKSASKPVRSYVPQVHY
jgi:hypothetical protein